MRLTDESSALVITQDGFRAWVRLVTSAGMFAAAVFVAVDELTALGVVVASFFGLCTLLYAQFLIRGVTLELSRDDFALRTAFGVRKHSWQEVKRFGFSGSGPVKIVCFELTCRPARAHPLRLLSHALSGFDYGIPNAFSLSQDELIEVLRGWHARADGVPGTP